jgi:hypothetical protein
VSVGDRGCLRTECWPRRDEVMGGGTKLRNEELHGLYPLPSIIRTIEDSEMDGACSTNGGRRGMCIGYW